MQKYLRKAVFVFTLGLMSSVLLSSPLTASIGEPLAEEATHQNVKRILDTHLNDNRDLLNSSKDQNIVVFLGATGAGKSTLINFLTNHPLRLNEDEELELENPTDLSAMKIGNRGVSETFLPRGLSAEGFVFYDLAGFRDTRGTAINLVNASFIKHLIENARSTRLVFVAGQDEITASRGESFKNLLRITQSLFPNSTALDQLSLLVITKSIKRTAEDLIPYLEQRLEDRQRVALWLNPSRLSPMSKGTDAVQKATILQKIRSLPTAVIRDVNIEAIYSEDVRRALTEIFVLEMTKAKDETWSSAPINPISINDIDKARVYFSGTFEGDVLSKVNGSSLFCLLKPLSERGFADEQAKLLATIKHIRDLKLSQLELQKEKLQREEEQKRLRIEEEKRNEELKKIVEQNYQLQQQIQAVMRKEVEFEPVPGKLYQIKNRRNGNNLCAWNGQTNHKGSVGMWEGNADGPNVHWYLIKNNEHYKIKSGNAWGNILCAWNFETDRGSVGMWEDNADSPNIHWYLIKEEGYYKIKCGNASGNILCSWGDEKNIAGSTFMTSDISNNYFGYWHFIPIN